jgi:hypothetical protein
MRIYVKPEAHRSKDRQLQNWAGLSPAPTENKPRKCTDLKTGHYIGVARQGAAVLRPYKLQTRSRRLSRSRGGHTG